MKNQLNLLIVAAIMMFLALGCFGPDGRPSDEGNVISSLRGLNGAQAAYNASVGEGNFAASFDQLVDKGLIDSKFRGVKPEKYGYIYSIRAIPKEGVGGQAKFSVNADPILAGEKDSEEKRHFFIDESGNVHHSKGRSATVQAPVL